MPLRDLDTSDQVQERINDCFDAVELCESCATSCIAQGDTDLSRRIDLRRGITDLTTIAATLMSRNSECHTEVCEVCAEAREACAEDCRKHDMGPPQACAEVLDQCVESCREMAQPA